MDAVCESPKFDSCSVCVPFAAYLERNLVKITDIPCNIATTSVFQPSEFRGVLCTNMYMCMYMLCVF